MNSPRHITASDVLSDFDCGVPELNRWLRHRALQNHSNGASRCYVMPNDGGISGYYCLSAGSIEHADTPGNVKRNMPDPIPVIILGRLAVDLRCRGLGIGSTLLLHALQMAKEVAKVIGVRAILVQAKDEASARFYGNLDFHPTPTNPLVLLQRL